MRSQPLCARRPDPRACHEPSPDPGRPPRGGTGPPPSSPTWPDAAAFEQALKQLASLPPLVFAGEARELTRRARPGRRRAGVPVPGRRLRRVLRRVLRRRHPRQAQGHPADGGRAHLLVGVPVVKVGRIAGQFAKPRSSPTEAVDGVELPGVPRPHRQRRRPHRGGPDAGPGAAGRRLPPVGVDAEPAARLHQGRLRRPVHECTPWNQEFVASSSARAAATRRSPARSTGRCGSCAACGIDTEHRAPLHEVDFYTSHEALILGYEEALTRQDSLTGDWYDCSAHMLWVGERTRQLDGAHVEFLARRRQPARLQGRARRPPPTRWSRCARRSTRREHRAG